LGRFFALPPSLDLFDRRRRSRLFRGGRLDVDCRRR
jgi:hypothetical protein